MRDECEHGSLRRSCTVCDLLDDVRDLEQERDELKAKVERLRNACQLGIDMMEANDCDLPKTFETMYEAMNEPGSWDLARIKAEAIEEAVEATRAKMEQMAERLGPPSVEQSEGIKGTFLDLRMYASEIRQSASQSGGGDDS